MTLLARIAEAGAKFLFYLGLLAFALGMVFAISACIGTLNVAVEVAMARYGALGTAGIFFIVGVVLIAPGVTYILREVRPHD